MFKISFTITLIKNNNDFCIYNWLNGEYVCFPDSQHPFLKIILNEVECFDKFLYDGSYDDFNWLFEKNFIISNNYVIKNIISNSTKDTDKSLSLTLLPVDNACNFRCKYCYENHDKKNYMRAAELDAILKFITNQEVDYLSFEFFGGEPLLNKDFIIKISEKILSIRNIKYTGSITTNAFLLNIELFKTFLKLNIVSYQITIDGLEEDHNYLRPLQNSKGTYKRIVNNLLEISNLDKSYEFDMMIRVNFNTKTASKEKRHLFLKEMASLFGNDTRFSFIFRPIGDYMLANNYDVMDKQEFLCLHEETDSLQKQYEKDADNVGLDIAEMRMYVGEGSSACYAGKSNSLVIDSSLTVKKCTVALDDPINNVGYIDNSGIFHKNKNWKLWTQSQLFKEDKCSTCFFISQCQSNNCRLKDIKNESVICPSGINENKDEIAKNIINYIEKSETNNE